MYYPNRKLIAISKRFRQNESYTDDGNCQAIIALPRPSEVSKHAVETGKTGVRAAIVV